MHCRRRCVYWIQMHGKKERNMNCNQIDEPPLTNCVLCVENIPLEYMHLICLGVIRWIIKARNNGILNPGKSARIYERLRALRGKLPSLFARQPRGIEEWENWKATEISSYFVLYCYGSPKKEYAQPHLRWLAKDQPFCWRMAPQNVQVLTIPTSGNSWRHRERAVPHQLLYHPGF